MFRIARVPWRWWRRGVQLAFVVLLLVSFRAAAYGGSLPAHGASWWFRFDPLTGAAAMLADQRVIWGMLIPAAILLALTLVFGRFFCGWICPLGTLLDWTGRVVAPLRRITNDKLHIRLRWLRPTRYVLLVIILVAAIFNLTLVGFFDPFALLLRGMTLAGDPALSRGTFAAFDWLYQHAPGPVTAVSEPTLTFMQNHVLAFAQASFAMAWIAAIMLGVIFLLELFQKRFWCRNLCPLGAMLGLVGRWSLVRRFPVKSCVHCGQCLTNCRMNAFDNPGGRISPEACTLCMDCVDDCPDGLARFGTRRALAATAPIEPSRRVFLAAALVGAAMPALAYATAILPRREDDPAVIRPPGTGNEQDFLDRCVRCGLCMKVCPTNALQPAMLQGGPEGLFAPMLDASSGYCEYECTLCSEVCPTGAIAAIGLAAKQNLVIGKAEFDENRCIPYADREPCLVCEEHCPVPEKAIKLRDEIVVGGDGVSFTLQVPHVQRDLCIGCGICQNKCPLEGDKGINVAPPPGGQHPRHQGRGEGRGEGQGRGRGLGRGRGRHAD